MQEMTVTTMEKRRAIALALMVLPFALSYLGLPLLALLLMAISGAVLYTTTISLKP